VSADEEREERPRPTAQVLSLLEARAARLRVAESTDEPDEGVLWVATFSVGEDLFALPLSAVSAAIPLRMVTAVPLSSPEIVGIVRFQGELVSVFSLASVLGGRGWRADPTFLLIIKRRGGGLVAFDCSQIPMATTLPLRAVEEARARSTEHLLDIWSEGSGDVTLIDVERTFQHLEQHRGA
jgi:purine-binding chemotaxis protein CheW